MTFQRVFFPVWMGGGVRTNVPDGARALRAALGGDALEIAVPADANLEPVNGIKARSEILEALTRAQETLQTLKRPALLGSDCGGDFALVAQSNARFAPDLAVVWLDGHADLNTSQSSPSKHFHGQVLRALLGDTDEDFRARLPKPLEPRQIFYGGVRDFDPPELEYIRSNSIPVLESDALRADPSALARVVKNAGFSRVHIHLDLDVLSSELFTSTAFPSPGGVSPAELEAVIHALTGTLEVVSFAVTEYHPREQPDLETVMRLVHTLEHSPSV